PSGCETLSILLAASGDDHQRIVRQRSLQRQRLFDRRGHPKVDFFALGQNHRHCLRVVSADQLVRFGREEAEEINGDFPFLQFPDRPPLRRPYASEECKRPRLVQGEPDWRPCAIRKRLILRETRERNNAAILNSEPPPPVRGVDVANVRHAWVRLPTDKIFGRRWHPPPSQCQLAAFRLI